MAEVRAGRLQDALRTLEAGVRANPGDALLRNAYGAVLLSAGRAALARTQLEQAVRLSGDFTAAKKNLAMACFELADYACTERYFGGIRGDPAVAPAASLFLGLVAEKQGR
jgi:Flp pilus assembly protein TadD